VIDTHITIKDESVLLWLNELRARVADITPALEEIGNSFRELSRITFTDSTDPYGRPWKPLKSRKGQPLLDTNRLRDSIASTPPVVTDNSVEVGTNVKYAGAHQNGATIERAAYSRQVRHRTDAKGNLLRTKLFGGKGLIFAKDRHKRVKTRWFEVGPYTITIPARKFLPDGDRLPGAWAKSAIDIIDSYLVGAA